MNMKKKSVVIAILVLTTALAFGGGGSSGRSGAGTPSGPFQRRDANVNEPGVLPVVKNQIALSFGTGVNIQVSDYDNNDLTKYFEKLTNIKLNFILYDPGADGDTKFGLQVAAGDKLPDIIMGLGIPNKARRESYGQAGALLPLNDYLDNLGYFTQKALEQTTMAKNGMNPWVYGTDDNGVIWGYISYSTISLNSYSGRAWYNSDFAQKLGMGEWTGGGNKGKIPTQEWFYNYLVGVRDNDVNGNGDKNDEIPLIGGTGWRQQVLKWLTQQYIYNDYSSTDNFWFIRNGQLYYSFNMPEYREALRFINKLYRERLFEDTAITQNGTTLYATVNARPLKAGVVVANIADIDAEARQIYKAIPIVEGPDGFATATYFQEQPSFPWAISSNCLYPEAAFRWFDAMASDPDFPIYPRYGLKDRDWRVARSDEIGLFHPQSDVPPYVVQLVQTWGNAITSAHWKMEFGIDYMNRKSSMTWNRDPTEFQYMNAQAVLGMIPFRPAEYPVGLIFTTAENEQWAEIRTNVLNYANQCLAEFATGQLDVDRDWDTYIRNLRALGAEQLLTIDQAAYARMMN